MINFEVQFRIFGSQLLAVITSVRLLCAIVFVINALFDLCIFVVGGMVVHLCVVLLPIR